MVDFNEEDRIDEIKKLLKKIEEKDEELKKKVEELNKEKEGSDEDKKKIEDLLQEAIEEKDTKGKKAVIERQDSGVRTESSATQPIETTVREEAKPDQEEETAKPSEAKQPVYRAIEQNPVVSEMYSRLDATYKSIPATITSGNRIAAQADLYHSLSDLRKQLKGDKYAEGDAQIAPRQSSGGYNEEVQRNPHSHSQMFERLVERVHQMSEGQDKFDYMPRIENVITELRQDFNDIIYKQKEEKEE